MSWVMAGLVVFAAVYIIVDMVQDARTRRSIQELRTEYKELTVRVNVNDEVITLHSEEIDEIQRHDLAKRMVQELEAQSGKVCVINTGKDDGDGQNV